MFNVTVINIKKSSKYIIILLITLISIYCITRKIQNIEPKEILQINISEELIKCLSQEIPALETTYYKSGQTIFEDDEEDENLVGKILGIELAQVENKIEETIENQVAEVQEEIIEDNNEEVLTDNVITQVVTQNPITESYNIEINGVKIKNETSFEISQSILDNVLEINENNITIFHTHTCESYTPTEQYSYVQTGNFRTTDLNYTVARVGDELTSYLLRIWI